MKTALPIKTRIIVSIILIILFFGTIATIGVFYLSRNQLLSERKTNLITFGQDKTLDLNLTLKQLQISAQKVSQTPKIIDALNQPSSSSSEEIQTALEHRNHQKNFSRSLSSLY